MRKRLEHRSPPDARLTHAVDTILRARGRVRVERLAGELEISLRKLQRDFSQRVGFSPKALCRIVRFQSLLRRAGREETPHWGELAAAYGYFDQAHLIRDFRELAGASPGRFASEQHTLSDLFTGLSRPDLPE